MDANDVASFSRKQTKWSYIERSSDFEHTFRYVTLPWISSTGFDTKLGESRNYVYTSFAPLFSGMKTTLRTFFHHENKPLPHSTKGWTVNVVFYESFPVLEIPVHYIFQRPLRLTQLCFAQSHEYGTAWQVG